MNSDSSPNVCEHVPCLPDERIEFVFDARAGLLDERAPGGDALIATNLRLVRVGAGHGSRVLTMLPLSNISAVEAVDTGRALDKLGQGILLLAVGFALGGGSWVVLGVQALSVLLGGLPMLAGVYALAGWAFPDTEGQLRVHTFGQVFAQPLRSSAARRDAPEAAARLYSLAWSETLAGASKLVEIVTAAAQDVGPAPTDGAPASTDGAPASMDGEPAPTAGPASADGAGGGSAPESDVLRPVSESAERGGSLWGWFRKAD